MVHLSVLPNCCGEMMLLQKNEVESINHILLDYHLVWKLWSEILDWWNLSCAIPGSIGGLLEWWDGLKFKRFERRL
ncbi:unnamed protein product [Camellia sinensis]